MELRADARRSRASIIDTATTLLRSNPNASLEEIARRAGVGSATLHRHFPGRKALLEAVFVDHVEQLCAAADRISQESPPDQALWDWLREVAQHCTQEKALLAMVRMVGPDLTAPDRSFASLERAGQPLLDRAAAANAVRPDVTITDLLQLVNAVADVCDATGADVDRLLAITWTGPRPRR